ncbi:aminoglycoside phosphotransferase family protein [Phytoactinopolyspora alkaliphila]|uniref:Aminoglycoside phosphotransferase family protein n=1 Tax=Phytoactinopolyspora alkaliphila TaxID=1783498 RepID=A0A6N9YN09_9ACTN|nr:aminoglycoside phosphotransferase family protein [Phytoactinopolyspora alkaliphila]
MIKRTRGKPEHAAAIAHLTAEAADSGVPVVRAVETRAENPAAIGEHIWVAYPFIEGDVYSGSDEHIAGAGELLGRLHATATRTRAPAFSWPDPDEESVAEDQDGLAATVGPWSAATAQALSELVARFPAAILPRVRDAGLPECTIVTDYKANNLIYTAEGPVLVDPDNADHGPRLFDLAFAALQFHSEHPGAPSRTFDVREWTIFTTSYQRHVQLTPLERELWPTVVEYVLSEESVWTLVESDDWDDERERAFLLDLAQADAARFPLPD